MTETWELSNKDFKSVMIKNFSNQLQTSLRQRGKRKIVSTKKEKICKVHWMGSTQNGRYVGKEWAGRQKVPSLNTDRKLDWKKTGRSLMDLWGYKMAHLITLGSLEFRMKGERTELKTHSNNDWNATNVKRGTKPQIQEAEQTPHTIQPKKSMPRHMVIKLLT